MFLAALPVYAQSGSDPWDNAVNVLKTAFTGTIATGLSLVAIVIGGLMFAYGEGQAKKTIAGIVFGVGMAIGAVKFLSTSDPDTARYGVELCGKADKTKVSYTVSESSSNANVGWLSGRTSSNKGSVSASKQYQKHKEPLFDENVFFELKNAQAIVIAFNGISPLPPTYCYLKLDFLPVTMTWFDQERIEFDPERILA
jgi:type IV secretory pathway VirB2 component (pilin)